jgi:hypothetical protein
MHDGCDGELGENFIEQVAIRDGPFEERDVLGHDIAKTVRKVVNHDYVPASVPQGQNGVAPDIPGPARYEHYIVRHAAPLLTHSLLS